MAISVRRIQELISEARYLEELSPGDLDKIATIASTEELEPGTVLFKEGDICERLYIVTAGLVGLDMCMPRRGCTRILTAGPGDLVGWSAMLGGQRATARATIIDTTTVVAIPTPSLLELCDVDHDIGYAMMRQVSVALSRRLLATRLQLLDMFGETQPATARGTASTATATKEDGNS